jgi:uncharacterized protein
MLNELSSDQMNVLWMRGGFPDSLLAPSDELSIQWRQDFILTYLQRDLAFMGFDIRVPYMKLRQFWQMLAHTHGQLINLSQLSMNMELSRQSVQKYLNILQETFMVRQIQPYHLNVKKRLIKSPKVFIRDSGILHTLTGIGSLDELIGHPAAGNSWEGFCMEQILSQLPHDWNAFFYRTQAGAEVDLVLQRGLTEAPLLIEFKYSQSPKLAKGFWEAKTDLEAKVGYVIHPGSRSYPLADSVDVLPLCDIQKICQD